MSKEFANSFEIKRKSTNLKAEPWGGISVKMEQCSETLEQLIGSVAFKIRSYIVD